MKNFIFFIVTVLLTVTLAMPVLAHPGRTDSSGGHTDHSTGEYHYHHGYTAHDHWDMDGDGFIDCPYEFKDTTNSAANDEDKTEDNYNAQKDSADARNGFQGVLTAVLEVVGMIVIGYAFFGLLFLFFTIKDAISQRRYRKGKKVNYSVLFILLSAFLLASSMVIVFLFSSSGPGFENSPVAALDYLAIMKSLGVTFLLWLLVAILIGNSFKKIPNENRPPVALYYVVLSSSVISALFLYLSFIFGAIA